MVGCYKIDLKEMGLTQWTGFIFSEQVYWESLTNTGRALTSLRLWNFLEVCPTLRFLSLMLLSGVP
jgi:hypothetical protein